VLGAFKVGFETCVSCFFIGFFFVPLCFGLLECVMHLYSYIIIFLKNCVIDAIFLFVCSLVSSSKKKSSKCFVAFCFSYVCSFSKVFILHLTMDFFFLPMCSHVTLLH